MTNNNWLQNLKAGDTVMRQSTSIGSVATPVKIDRVTATQIIIGSTRFRRSDGHRMGEGNSWYSHWISEATPEAIEKANAELRRRKLINDLREVDWRNQKTELLETVWQVIQGENKE